jgi:hypothetical protein
VTRDIGKFCKKWRKQVERIENFDNEDTLFFIIQNTSNFFAKKKTFNLENSKVILENIS